MKSLSIAVLFVCSALAAGGPVQPHISGGFPAAVGQFPWQVELYIRQNLYSIYCSGALISDQWVLTSGDCAYDAYEITIYMGSLDSLGGLRLYSEEAYTHFDYKPPNGVYDPRLEHNIGLVKLPGKITFTDTVSPIALQGKGGIIEEGVELVVSGWGATGDLEFPSKVLRYAELTSISNAACENTYGWLPAEVLCATGNVDQSGPCYRDDGAPLVRYKNDGSAVLVGVHFLQKENCELNYPTGYTRIAPYRDWINYMIST